MLYGDNAGRYRQFRFDVSPAFSFSYSRELSDELDIRATVGIQLISSGDFDANNIRKVKWGEQSQAYKFTGQAFFLDGMAVYQFNPTPPGMVGYPINYYAGVGLGVILSDREDLIAMDVGQNFQGLPTTIDTRENRSTITGYIPLRAGASTNLEGLWDMGFELTVINTTSNFDGNNVKNKILPWDVLLQAQVTFKRYIGR